MTDTISALRINLWDTTSPYQHPGTLINSVAPTNALRHAWIPQTIMDQIWALYEFASVEDREAWERGLPDGVSRWLDRRLVTAADKYGWEVHEP